MFLEIAAVALSGMFSYLEEGIDLTETMRSLSLKSPKNGRARPAVELARFREKPLQCMSPKRSTHRIIQQPR